MDDQLQENVLKLSEYDKQSISITPSRSNLYARLAKYTPRAITTLAKLMSSKNDMVRLNAVRLLLSKVLPDLKSVEGDNNKNTFNITVNMGNGYKPYTQPIVIDSNDIQSVQDITDDNK